VAQGLAEDASSLAQEWAENPEDDAVTGHPGEYSAYHWSKKAEAAASGGAVKVSANDTTPGYLEAKVVASTGIVLTTQNEGANETRSIAADVGTAANKILQLNASAQIPAVDGSLLTGLTAAQISGLESGMPTGAVIAVASSTVPSGFLECDGAAVSRASYASLFAAVGVAHGYGDNSTTFNLPDYRGRFLRGWDHGIARDPDRASRTAMATGGATGDSVGSVQAEAFKSHTHSGQAKAGGALGFGSGSEGFAAIGSTGGNETRPINANVMYCIKY
jgi:microcystin-dependent protein